MRWKYLEIGLCVSLLCSCATYEKVESNATQKIGPLGVIPSHEWNSVPREHSIGKAETWTANGAILDSVAFFVGIKHDTPMMKASGDKNFPKFNREMLPHEIVELVQASYALEMGASITHTGELQPASFGSIQGFEFDFDFTSNDDLKRKAFVRGTVHNGQLFLVAFQAAALHYYDKHLAAVKNMLATATISR